MSNRRNFLKSALAGATGLAAIPAVLSAAEINTSSTGSKSKLQSLNKGDVILFQGDSITDAGRNKESKIPNDQKGFGSGYAFLTAADLLNAFACR